jgi:hypothetical protein
MAQAAGMAAMMLAPGLSTFGAGNSGSIFPEDQGLTNQMYLTQAINKRDMAIMEDSAPNHEQTNSSRTAGVLAVLCSGVCLSCIICCFSIMAMVFLQDNRPPG